MDGRGNVQGRSVPDDSLRGAGVTEKQTIRTRVSKPEQATVLEEVKREQERLTTPNKATGRKAITSLWPGILIVPNAPSGSVYRWDQAGAQVLVADNDVEFVMSRNRTEKHACCGSGGARIYFAVAD